MTPERWQEVEEIFHAAIDRAPQERAAFLHEACAGDDELRSEAAELIDAHEEARDFIEQPAIAHDARVLVGASVEDNIGHAVGPYRIIEQLGAGGMGEVYLAEDGRLNRPVALKILPAYFLSDDTRLRRFQREARAASALNHPNILTIYEVGESTETHFIATEFIDGQTLRELIADANLSLEEILQIAEQLASALAAAHAAGIVHRDIKPENIMRRTDGLVKVLDFGIAKLLEQSASEFSDEANARAGAQTEAGIIMGTVNYMSPEQARALPVDERTDIWSLGVVLYEMLAGRVPFACATRLDTLVSILEREPAPLFSESLIDAPAHLQNLASIISKALQKERGERYQSVTEMLRDLKSLRQELSLAPAFEEKAVMDALLQARREESDEKSAASASRPTASTILASTDISRAVGPAARKVIRRHLSFTLAAIVLLSVVVAGIFFYGRKDARRIASLPDSAPPIAAAQKLYKQMSEREQLAFIDKQEQHISSLMGDGPAKLNDEALRAIKLYVDRYMARVGSTSDELGKDDIRIPYSRATQYVPLIARSFAARKVPVIIGLYLPMVESEYRACAESKWGAKGLFQFLPQTAMHYGVAHEEMCDVEKMTPAAAHYIADRMAELGDDAESMTLVLLSYNRGPEGVRDALRQLRDVPGYERNFWTLFAHRDKLGRNFREENAAYVPAFFAAAIIGENPRAFELQTPPLSTLIDKSSSAKP